MPDKKFERVAVFCGASQGRGETYLDCARAIGEELVKRNIKLVYGGGNVGCMGVLASTVSKCLGPDSVVGVIPEALKPREVSGDTVGQIITVRDMHERKAKMSELADAFIAIPGGYGTLEEIVEMLTWLQLGIHTKPVGFLNWHGFFDHFFKFLDHAMEEEFVRKASRAMAIDDATPAGLLDKLLTCEPPQSLIALIQAGKIDRRIRG